MFTREQLLKFLSKYEGKKLKVPHYVIKRCNLCNIQDGGTSVMELTSSGDMIFDHSSGAREHVTYIHYSTDTLEMLCDFIIEGHIKL